MTLSFLGLQNTLNKISIPSSAPLITTNLFLEILYNCESFFMTSLGCCSGYLDKFSAPIYGSKGHSFASI